MTGATWGWGRERGAAAQLSWAWGKDPQQLAVLGCVPPSQTPRAQQGRPKGATLPGSRLQLSWGHPPVPSHRVGREAQKARHGSSHMLLHSLPGTSAQLYKIKINTGLPGEAERWLLFCQCELVHMSIIWQLGRERA